MNLVIIGFLLLPPARLIWGIGIASRRRCDFLLWHRFEIYLGKVLLTKCPEVARS